MATDAQILQAVKDAIFDLVGSGKAVAELNVAGRTLRRYDLSQLQELERYYSQKVALGGRRRVYLADVSGDGG